MKKENDEKFGYTEAEAEEICDAFDSIMGILRDAQDDAMALIECLPGGYEKEVTETLKAVSDLIGDVEYEMELFIQQDLDDDFLIFCGNRAIKKLN